MILLAGPCSAQYSNMLLLVQGLSFVVAHLGDPFDSVIRKPTYPCRVIASEGQYVGSLDNVIEWQCHRVETCAWSDTGADCFLGHDETSSGL